MSESMEHSPALKTGEEWDLLLNDTTRIVDPDGWRRDGVSFKDTMITEEEFYERSASSTAVDR